MDRDRLKGVYVDRINVMLSAGSMLTFLKKWIFEDPLKEELNRLR